MQRISMEFIGGSPFFNTQINVYEIQLNFISLLILWTEPTMCTILARVLFVFFFTFIFNEKLVLLLLNAHAGAQKSWAKKLFG